MRHSLLRYTSLLAVALLMTTPSYADQAKPAAQPAAEASERAVLRKEIAQGIYEIAWSARQKALFVASAGGRGEEAETSRVLRLDPDTLEVLAEHSLPGRGFGLTIDDAADRLYVGDTMGAAVTVLDTVSGAVIGTVQLAEKTTNAEGKESYPHHFRQFIADPGHDRLYTPGFSTTDSAFYAIDTKALTVEKVIPGFGFVATGIALDSAKNRAFVSNLEGQIRTVDTTTLDVTHTADVAGDQLLNLAYDPATDRLFATDQGHPMIVGMMAKSRPDYQVRGTGNQVLVTNAADGSEIARLATGEGPIALLLDTARARLFVTNRGAGTVTVFDTDSYALLETISLPSHPNSLTFDPVGNVLWVTVKNGEADPKGGRESLVRIAF